MRLGQVAMTINLLSWGVVDLTHVIHSRIPIWPQDPAIDIKQEATIDSLGYRLHSIKIGEHSGTHIGTSSHFLEQGVSVDQIEPRSLIMEAVVLSVQSVAEQNNDYALSVDDITVWEEKYGRIPEASAVLLHTGWSRYWDTPERYLGIDENQEMHFPGFSVEVVNFLMIERGVALIGIDTHGIDTGENKSFDANYALFENGGKHLENLANLNLLPPRGAIIVVGALPIQHGSGSPCRVLGLIPPFSNSNAT